MRILTENLFFLPIATPATGGVATFYTPRINMGLCLNAEFIISMGALTTANYTITVGCSAAAGYDAPTTDLPFRYRMSSAAGVGSATSTDTMGVITNVALATGVPFVYTTDSNKTILIDVASSELTQGYPYLGLTVTRGGSAASGAIVINAIVQPRYPQISSKDGSGVSFFA